MILLKKKSIEKCWWILCTSVGYLAEDSSEVARYSHYVVEGRSEKHGNVPLFSQESLQRILGILCGLFESQLTPVLWIYSLPLLLFWESQTWASWERNKGNYNQLWEWCAGGDIFPKSCYGKDDNVSGLCLKCFDTDVTFSHIFSSPVEQKSASLGKVLGHLCCSHVPPQTSWAEGELTLKCPGSEVHTVPHLCKVGFGIYHIKVFKFMKQLIGAQLISWVTFLQNKQPSCLSVNTG